MKSIVTITLTGLVIGGCGSADDSVSDAVESTTQVATAVSIQPGQVMADNVIIFDKGRALSRGPVKMALGETDPATGEKVYTGRMGQPEPAGPKIAFVVRSVPEGVLKDYHDHGIAMSENTAYLLPEGVQLSPDALRDMTPVGAIDTELSNEEIVALFGVQIPEPQWVPAPD
ncbi:MAG: hypothetical protein R3E77_13920 [Steroidobacteraceae bacterium]